MLFTNTLKMILALKKSLTNTTKVYAADDVALYCTCKQATSSI